MHPSALLLLVLVVVAGGATVVPARPSPSSAITPAAKFWQQALPGTTMPDAIADLVQKGIDHSPLVEHYHALPSVDGFATNFNSAKDPRAVAETGIFFHEEQLRPGSAMTLSFPAEPDSAILPQDVAEKVPFGNLQDVLSTFNIPAGSAEAALVRDTLSMCQQPPVAGEVKASCTTSLESTVRTAVRMLGTNQGVLVATSSALLGAGLPRGQYVVQAAKRVDGGGYVSCHRMPFPYAVYQCHTAGTAMSYGAYVVSLTGLNGGGGVPAAPAVSMLAFCHVDTSGWNPAHPAFKILNTRPGGTPVCHFMPSGDLAFVRTKAGIA